MDALAAKGTGDDLHWSGFFVAPCASDNFSHTASPCREERCVPGEQPVLRKLFFVLLRSVEHHLDHTFDVAVGGRQRCHVASKTARDRGPHLILVEDFALDLARLENILGQGLEHGLLTEGKSKLKHPAYKSALAMPDCRKLPGEAVLIPLEFGPIRQFVDISSHSPHLLRRLYWSFTA